MFFDRGLAQYEAGQYAEAIESYHAAYELLPLPLLLFDLAQAHRLSGDGAKAMELYQKYLDVEPKGHAAPEARQRLAELRRAKLAREAVAVKPPPVIAPVVAPPPSPAPVAEVAPVVAAPVLVAPAPPPKSRKWLWGVVGGAAAVVLIGVGVGLGVGLSGGDRYPAASYGTGVLR